MSKLQKKEHFAKVCISEHRKQQKKKENTEPDETEESNSDRSTNIKTKENT